MSANRPPAEAAALDFEPVPLRYRRDGWTPARQAAFIAALRCSRCPRQACRHVDLSLASAYRLYKRAGAASFRRAWDAALALPVRPQAAPPTPTERPVLGLPPGLAAQCAAIAEAAIQASWHASISSTYYTSAAHRRVVGGPIPLSLDDLFLRIRSTGRLRLPRDSPPSLAGKGGPVL